MKKERQKTKKTCQLQLPWKMICERGFVWSEEELGRRSENQMRGNFAEKLIFGYKVTNSYQQGHHLSNHEWFT